MSATVRAIPFARARGSGRVLRVATLAGYLFVCASIGLMWSVREQNLIRAEDGAGYWLGIVGATLMLLLLVYPLRKRVRALARLGSVRFWFRTHMIFGVLGPLLVLFHSNFKLASLNGKVAMLCTLIVASSGIVGRYLYAKIHHGMYGQRATLASLQAESRSESKGSTRSPAVVSLIDEFLRPYEQRVLEQSAQVLPSLLAVLVTPFRVMRLQHRLKGAIREAIDSKAAESCVVAEHRERLLRVAETHLARRLATYRKLAQVSGFERLFGLWHVVHFPLFLVMVLAAILHVIAVHAY